jgi:hypothetical protein
MNWSVFHPLGFYMCDIEIGETGDYNVVMINDADSPEYRRGHPAWVKNPGRTDREQILEDLKRRGIVGEKMEERNYERL